MKKSPLVIIIITGFLLSSCSKLVDITITKRLYRSGYYVDLGSNKQHMTMTKASAPMTSEEIISEAIASATTPSASDKLKDNCDVSPEKITPELSPVIVSGNKQKKKQAHKKASENVYASTQDLATFKKEMQAVLLKNNIALNENIINSTTSSSSETPQWLLIVLSIILPPLAIALKFGFETKFWISCLLTLLFWVPGVIYALYWILKT